MKVLALFVVVWGAFATSWQSTGRAQVVVEIEVNDTPTDTDDYVVWCPIGARARAIGGTTNLGVEITSTKRMAGGNNGEVVFAAFSSPRPSPSTFNPQETLTLTLPASGAWKPFFVAGKHSSADGKDTKIVVKNAPTGPTLLEHPVMVRVRKNAESLSPLEAERYLSAVAKLHDLANSGAASKYVKYVHIHSEAFDMGIHHGAAAFSPWHRTMLLSFERELQQIDPRVALPYWKFDQIAPKLFSQEFIGTVTGSSSTPGGFVVNFSSGNPMRGWKMPSNTAIAAMTGGGPIPSSIEPLLRVRDASTTVPNVSSILNQTPYSVMNDFLELNYHNAAHSHILGWLGTAESPKDPLFFLLHANVDRAWAEWQKAKNAFNGSNSQHFAPQGTYPGSGAIDHQGSYADDTQWPWNMHGGTQGNSDNGDDWPAFTFGLPIGAAGLGPSSTPITKECLDYLDVQGNSSPHGYCYDTVKWN